LLFAQAWLDHHPTLYGSHHCWNNRRVPPSPAIGWEGVSWTPRPDWHQTKIFLISTFQADRITGVSHRLPDEKWSTQWFRTALYQL
jgi:hypothetical protein